MTLRVLCFLCLTLLAAVPLSSWAQTHNDLSQAVVESRATVSMILLFRGEPMQAVEIRRGQQTLAVTDAFGNAVLMLDAGVHDLSFRVDGQLLHRYQAEVRQSEIQQLIFSFQARDAEPVVDVERSIDADPTDFAQTRQMVEAVEVVNGTLKGRIISAHDQQPIARARVFVSGTEQRAVTDQDGRFEMTLPVGSYAVSVLSSRFNSTIRNEVSVLAQQASELLIELTPAGSELPEFVVIEPFIEGSLASVLEARRNTATVANFLSMEQISKSGDSDAAGALKRVTGLTLVDGRFIYIRGLGERYSNTLLNGANMPSPDPTRRVVPLDLFPTGIIGSIEVQKGYDASFPAEFGGGAVVLRTVSIPDDNHLTLSMSSDYNSQTTGKTGLSYRGGEDDWIGYDDGTREIPPLLADAIEGGRALRPANPFFPEGFSAEELEAIGESLPSIYTPDREEIDPGIGLGISAGLRHDFDNEVTAGVSAAIDYGSSFETRREVRRDFNTGSDNVLILESEERSLTTRRDIDLSGFLTAGVQIGDLHSVSANLMLLRNTEDYTDIGEGFNEDLGNSRRIVELRWRERELLGWQLFGEHRYPALADLTLNWQLTDADATLSDPDNRIYRYDQTEEGQFVFSARNDSNSRTYSDLDDGSTNARYDLSLPVPLWNWGDLLITAGQNSVRKDRDSQIRRFVFEGSGPQANTVNRQDDLEQILNPEFIDGRGYRLIEVTRATDNYFASLDVDAAYLGLDFSYKSLWRVALGVRQESADQTVTTFQLFDPDQSPVVARLKDDDLFPSFGSTLFLPAEQQIRIGYAETATRPDFKELSPAQFKDPVLDRDVIGNPELQNGRIRHYDLRYDKYFSSGEFISAGVFYKEFFNPIEIIILPGSAGIISYDNAETAENLGVEFEIYKDLGLFGERWSDWYLSANYAWVDSEITLSSDNAGGQTNNTRPLQGQSPYVVNLQLGYDNPDKGLQWSLLYNVFGKRISEAGTSGRPDVFEQPFDQLDLVYSQRFRDHWKLSLKASNLINDEVLYLQGDQVQRSAKKGRGLSVGIEYAF